MEWARADGGGATRWVLLTGLTALAVGLGILAGASPSKAIGLGAAIVFVPVIFTRYTLGVGIFIVSTFLGLSGTAQKGIGLLVIVAALQQILDGPASARGFVRSHRVLAALLLMYLVWCFAGLLWAGTPSEVTYSLTRYAPNFLVFLVVFVAARRRQDVLVIAGFFVAGAAVAAASAVLSPPPASVYGDVSRSAGIFGDPNDLAAVLVAGFTISAALAFVRAGTAVGQAALGDRLRPLFARDLVQRLARWTDRARGRTADRCPGRRPLAGAARRIHRGARSRRIRLLRDPGAGGSVPAPDVQFRRR